MKKRWIENMIKEVAEKDVAFPWQRGALRNDKIKTQPDNTEQKTASA